MLSKKFGDVSAWILEYLDQEPERVRDANEIITAVGNKIASGRALRTYEDRTKNNKGTSGRPPLTQEEQTASGRRSLVNAALDTLKTGGYLTLERREGKRWVQRVTACPTCHRPFPLASSTVTKKSVTTGNVVTPTNAPWWSRTGTEGNQ